MAESVVILGNGLCGLVIGALLSKRGCSVKLIGTNRFSGGVLTPLKVFGRDFDKGPQFLEGFLPNHNELLSECIDTSKFRDLGYNYGHFYNSKLCLEGKIE